MNNIAPASKFEELTDLIRNLFVSEDADVIQELKEWFDETDDDGDDGDRYDDDDGE
jgi:hypothetical protein